MARNDLRGQIETALVKCRDQASFFRFLLNDTLDWPVSGAQKIEDISFGWSPGELQAAGIERKLVDGPSGKFSRWNSANRGASSFSNSENRMPFHTAVAWPACSAVCCAVWLHLAARTRIGLLGNTNICFSSVPTNGKTFGLLTSDPRLRIPAHPS